MSPESTHKNPLSITQDPILNTVFHIQNNVPNNLNSSLGATPRVPQPTMSSGKAEKNVNIDRNINIKHVLLIIFNYLLSFDFLVKVSSSGFI